MGVCHKSFASVPSLLLKWHFDDAKVALDKAKVALQRCKVPF